MFEAVSSLGHNIEVNVKGVNKGDALVRLEGCLNPGRKRLWHSEMEKMISRYLREAVGVGIAMANGLDAVKAAARYMLMRF